MYFYIFKLLTDLNLIFIKTKIYTKNNKSHNFKNAKLLTNLLR